MIHGQMKAQIIDIYILPAPLCLMRTPSVGPLALAIRNAYPAASCDIRVPEVEICVSRARGPWSERVRGI